MSLGQELAPHLPFLRRYARALTGSQAHGDAFVRATLEAIVAKPDEFPRDVDPRLGLYAAVTRQDRNGQPPGGWLPGEKLTREEALRGFTADAAWSLFLDKEVGSLTVGKRADLVVFGRDPMQVPEREIPEAPVDMTLVDGRIAFQREGAR